jgi:hypothetical protein
MQTNIEIDRYDGHIKWKSLTRYVKCGVEETVNPDHATGFSMKSSFWVQNFHMVTV